MKKFKAEKNPKNLDLTNGQINNESQDNEDEKIDYNSMEVVVDRVEHGLIGTLRITDEINKPLFKNDDLVHIRATSRPVIKDFVLYKSHDEYFLRRIIKIKEDTAYVAGDDEKSYHIIHRDDIVGKIIGRQRGKKYLSFGLNPQKKLYTFNKVNLAKFRLGNRVTNYEQDVNNESLEIAQQALENQQSANVVVKNQSDVVIDADLSSFLDPEELVKQLRMSETQQEEPEYEEEYVEVEDEAYESEEIDENDIEANETEQIEESIESVDEDEVESSEK